MLFRFTGEDRSLQEKTWNYRNLTDLSMTDKQVSYPSIPPPLMLLCHQIVDPLGCLSSETLALAF